MEALTLAILIDRWNWATFAPGSGVPSESPIAGTGDLPPVNLVHARVQDRRTRFLRMLLHIGTSKAGSTALQDSLLLSRDVLLKHGVLYPTNADGIKFNNHRLLLQPLLKFSTLPTHVRRHVDGPEQLAAVYADFVASVREQIRRSAPACLIFSSENLFRSYPADRQTRFRSELDGFGVGSVDVVVYIRRPSARYLSSLQQGLKTRSTLKVPGMPEYSRPLASYADIFGQESLHPRLMDRSKLSGGSITIDFAENFLAEHGVAPEDLVPPQRTNDSVSAASMVLLDRFRQEAAAGAGFKLRELRRALLRIELGLSLSKPRLKPEIADMIDYSSTEPLWLRDTWGLEFPDFDYARLEVGRMENMQAIDTIDALIESPSNDDFAAIAEKLGGKFPNTPVTNWVTNMVREAV